MGLRDTYTNAQKYGWTYTQITIIGEEITETIISFGTQVVATIFLGALGVLFLFNSRLDSGYTLDIKPLKEGDETGILFPKGDPEDWDISVDPNTRTVYVQLNEFVVSFPLTMVMEWVEQHKKKKLEEMK